MPGRARTRHRSRPVTPGPASADHDPGGTTARSRANGVVMEATTVVRRPFAPPTARSSGARDEEHRRRATLGEDGWDARTQVKTAAATIDGPQHDQLIG